MNPIDFIRPLCALGLLCAALAFSACGGKTAQETKDSPRRSQPSVQSAKAPQQTRTPEVATPSVATQKTPEVTPSRSEEPFTRTMEEIALERIQEKEATLLLEVTILPDDMQAEEKHRRLVNIFSDYENFIARFPESELGYIFYGKLLRKAGMNQKANNMFFRANQINPNLPVVKQQIGNFLAEEGKFELALPYFLNAIELAPSVARYHYQLGELLYTYYEAFLSKKVFDRATLDTQMHHAFARAAELEPNELTYAFRYAESFYDLENPNWDRALEEWGKLSARAKSSREQDIIRLHQARIYIISGRRDEARALLSSINQPALEATRQELLLQVN